MISIVVVVRVGVAEESNYSEYRPRRQNHKLTGWSIAVGGSEGEKWELCLLSMEGLLNLEPFVCLIGSLFWSTAQQLFGRAVP